MRGRYLRLVVAGGAPALFALGCSQELAPSGVPSADRSAGPAPLIRAADGGEAVPGSYIVVFKGAVTDVNREVDEISARLGVAAKFRYTHALRGFAANLTDGAVTALRQDPRVDYIEQDQMAHAVGTQANPTWGLDRVDQRALPLDHSYTYNQTGAGVDAYIIDTGIRQTHTDFGGRAVAGVDEITPGGNANDGNGHGTHVAGTVGGATYGMAKAVHLVAVRVLDNSGSGTYTQVIAGVDWVTGDHTTHPAVANMSLSGPTSTALDQSVRNSIADGVVYCVAAGNSAQNVSGFSPADVAQAITVAASGSTDAWASFSNYGSGVDIIAPGVNVTSDWNSSDTATNTISGTSMATPHVTGAAALYLEANPGATPAQVSAALASGATPGVISGVPSGTVNLLLYALTGPPPPPPPAPVLVSPADGSTGVSTSPTLTWNASSGASSYEAQVATDSGFANLVWDQSGLSTTSTSVSGLAGNTTYYWRVNASNGGGTSPWSAVWSFTTGAGSPPPPPTLVSPTNGSTGVSRTPTLRWNASTGASSYRVQVSTSSSFNSTVFDRAGITTTSVTLPQLGRRTWYYWRVDATNGNGTGAWSVVWSFRTRN
jgi:aqualysin 1